MRTFMVCPQHHSQPAAQLWIGLLVSKETLDSVLACGPSAIACIDNSLTMRVATPN